MTRQESFKRRIRERMATTGERYAAARRVLLAQAEARAASGTRLRVSEPELSDERVAEATGRNWDAWCDVLDAWPGRHDGHAALAAHLQTVHGVDPWWAQTVTVGYERITGLRLPGQMADGTFTVSRTRTVSMDAGVLRALLVDEAGRAALFPDRVTELRSKPTSKALRVAFQPGTVLFTIQPRPAARVTVTVTHERLGTPEEMEEWRHWWSDWLDAIDDAIDDAPA